MATRALTPHEIQVRDARAREHLARLREAPSLLTQLHARLSQHAPGLAPEADASWASAADAAMLDARRDPDPHAIVWWVARLGQYVGSHLVEVHQGHWYLDHNPQGRTFLRSVVGGFGLRAAEVEMHADHARYDPFRIAATVFAEELKLEETLRGITLELNSTRDAKREGRPV